ncbi:hypothetical protein ABZ671_11125 [Micromonospora sp. NPDC006766]|uniref:hypothetical protein n=1 Tax=Micromonospora sp. NPDC006766 TaxID=3154778 RepID=UPI0033DCD300
MPWEIPSFAGWDETQRVQPGQQAVPAPGQAEQLAGDGPHERSERDADDRSPGGQGDAAGAEESQRRPRAAAVVEQAADREG